MKSTGIVRRIDSLGRVVIPIELRHLLDIGTRDGVEIYLEGEGIVLAKYREGCCFCGGTEGLERFRLRWICRECLEAMADPLRLVGETTGGPDFSQQPRSSRSTFRALVVPSAVLPDGKHQAPLGCPDG